METKTLSITDYEVVSPTIARVVVATTGHPTKNQMAEMIQAKFDNRVSPIENSFQVVTSGSQRDVAVGFVRTNREIRPVEEQEIRASYRVISSNIMMDNRDRSLWEIREGATGKFLARHSNEDLSELVEASVDRQPYTPNLRHVSMASAVKSEFASYVSKSGDVDHGFVLATSKNQDQVQILSMTTHMAEVVDMKLVTALSRVPVPKSFHKQMIKANISAADKAQAKEYWTKLYSYDPDYLAQVKQQVEETTFL